jgi:hypothetical protein
MKKLCLVLLIAVNSTLFAQLGRKMSFSAGFQVLQPTKESLKDENTPIGFGIQAMRPILRSPIEFGVGYSWNSLGTRGQVINAISKPDTGAVQNLTLEDGLKVISKMSRTTTHLRFRILDGKLQPIVEAICGMEVFRTDISLNEESIKQEIANSIVSSTQERLRIPKFFYGYGLGLRYQIIPHVLLEARVENLYNATTKDVSKVVADVAADGKVTIPSKDDLLNTLEDKKTDKFIFQIGIAIGL